MARKAFPWLSVLAMLVLLVAAVAPGAQAQPGVETTPPTVDGLFYGSDEDTVYIPAGVIYTCDMCDRDDECDPDLPTDGGLCPDGLGNYNNGCCNRPGYEPVEPPNTCVYSCTDPLLGCTVEGEPTLPVFSMYKYFVPDTGMLYFASVVGPCVNDTVFDAGTGGAYIQSAGWGAIQTHTFNDLYTSDMMQFKLVCASGLDLTYEWCQGLIYDENGNYDKPWASGYADPNGGCEVGHGAPDGITEASSLAWNMNNTLWNVKINGADPSLWKSPDTTGGVFPNPVQNDTVTDEPGWPMDYSWPPEGQQDYKWEWPLVYEWSVDLDVVCPNSNYLFDALYITSHNSPTKQGGTEPPPTAVDLLWFRAKPLPRSVVLGWRTASETNNLGFYVMRSESANWLTATKVNEEIIPSKVPFGGGGATYRYVDRGLQRHTTYYYWLVDVDLEFGEGWSDSIEVTTK